MKAKSRMERRDTRRAKEKGEEEMQVVPQEDAGGEVDGLDGLDEKAKKRVKEARRLIAAGMGKKGPDGPSKLEIAPRMPVVDDRKYGSDEEDYDSDDLAETLAAGTVMLRPSRAKQVRSWEERKTREGAEELSDERRGRVRGVKRRKTRKGASS